MAHPAESAFVGAIIGLVTALVAFPTRVGRLLAPAGGAIVDGLRWASEAFPYWAFILTVFLGTMIVTVFVAYEFARVGYAAVRRAGPRTKRIVGFVTPNTPIGKAAFAFCFTILFLVGSVWALPYVIGDIGASSPITDSSDLSDGNGGLGNATETREEIFTDRSRGESAEDAVRDARMYEHPRPDNDGDRLKDSWERAGETPGGVALPNADPDRMDLYVQIDYGTYTHPLSAREKRALKEIWAEMPVENPDGSTGITLHIDDGPGADGYGGAIGQEVVFTDGMESSEYYTAANLGPRRCRYHQVVVGEVPGSSLGRGSIPGYASVVEDQPDRPDSDVPARAHIITHELLHNVAGAVDGYSHTKTGWLSQTNDAFLSNATAEELSDGFAGSYHYQRNHC